MTIYLLLFLSCSYYNIEHSDVRFTRDQAKAEAALGEGARVFSIEFTIAYEGIFWTTKTKPFVVKELTRQPEPVKFKVEEKEVQIQ